ncbi:MAG TPA: hypothetical protein PKK23_15180 [Nitrospirales bacterium]|nr:hypothetical protein [Nitrospirales bacterium]
MASVVLGPFAKPKGLRLPWRNRATLNVILTPELGAQMRGAHLQVFIAGNP